jgi:hypothetical protein
MLTTIRYLPLYPLNYQPVTTKKCLPDEDIFDETSFPDIGPFYRPIYSQGTLRQLKTPAAQYTYQRPKANLEVEI